MAEELHHLEVPGCKQTGVGQRIPRGGVQFTHGLLGLNPEPQRFTAGHVGIREAIILDLGISHKP